MPSPRGRRERGSRWPGALSPRLPGQPVLSTGGQLASGHSLLIPRLASDRGSDAADQNACVDQGLPGLVALILMLSGAWTVSDSHGAIRATPYRLRPRERTGHLAFATDHSREIRRSWRSEPPQPWRVRCALRLDIGHLGITLGDPPDAWREPPIFHPMDGDVSIICPECGNSMAPEHAHYRCALCGYRDTCCDGAPAQACSPADGGGARV